MESLFGAIPSIVNSLPNSFTSHELILALAQKNQHAYIEALHEHLNADRPFQTLHSKIGKHLRQATHIVRYVSQEKDANIFGIDSDNALWEKVT
jgi:hypothetical protein